MVARGSGPSLVTEPQTRLAEMTLLNPCYSLALGLQLLLLAVDVACNAFTVLFSARNTVVLLVLYMIQDIALVFSLILIFLVFFSTFVFKAGLVSLLVRKFAGTLIVGVLYLALTVAFHIWNLSVRWGRTYEYRFNSGLQAMYVLQKLLAVGYYYLYKRAALRLGNPKYYEDSEWLRKHLHDR